MGEKVAQELGDVLNKFHTVPKAGHNDLLSGKNHEVTDGDGVKGRTTFFQALLNAMIV